MANDGKGGNRAFSAAMIVVVPIILFLVFFFYTREGNKDLHSIELPKVMFPLGVDTVLKDGNYVVDSVYHTIPDFSFTNQYGQTVSNETTKGKIYVTDFFFTSCPTICPKMTEQLVRVQDEFIRDEKVIILSHTVDPKRDSVQKLQLYAEKYGVIPGKWHLVTGNKAVLYEQARKGYFLSAADESVEIENDFVHTERFVLVDPNGHIRGYYYGTEENDVNRLMGDIVLLLKEFKKDD